MAEIPRFGLRLSGSRAFRRPGGILIELAIVKFVSLVAGIAIASAVAPATSGMGERLSVALSVEAGSSESLADEADAGRATPLPAFEPVGPVGIARFGWDEGLGREPLGELDRLPAVRSELASGDGNPVEATPRRFEVAAVGE